MSPDITKCDDEKCKRKKSCYRYTSPPDKYWQSFFAESPRKGQKCEYYLKEVCNKERGKR